MSETVQKKRSARHRFGKLVLAVTGVAAMTFGVAAPAAAATAALSQYTNYNETYYWNTPRENKQARNQVRYYAANNPTCGGGLVISIRPNGGANIATARASLGWATFITPSGAAWVPRGVFYTNTKLVSAGGCGAGATWKGTLSWNIAV
ncbi:hypothetical protein GCM10027416_12420 [Okibacterium endophyticum]